MANDRLPCPAAAANGVESPPGGGACTNPHNGFLPAATLGLGGTAQLFGYFRSPNNNDYAGSGGVITSATPAVFATRAINNPDDFGGRITGPVTYVQAATANTRNFYADNPYTGATVVTGSVLQLIDEGRLYGNLLSSMPLCFNLFGLLKLDLAFASRVLGELFPDLAGAKVGAVLFEHSPGRGDPALTGDHSAFDALIRYETTSAVAGALAVLRGSATRLETTTRRDTSSP
jgi:hypothetical protein